MTSQTVLHRIYDSDNKLAAYELVGEDTCRIIADSGIAALSGGHPLLLDYDDILNSVDFIDPSMTIWMNVTNENQLNYSNDHGFRQIVLPGFESAECVVRYNSEDYRGIQIEYD